MSATTPDVPRHPRTDRWVLRSGGESGRVSRAERRGEHQGHEARRACADASEKPDRPWHRTTSSSRIITLRIRRVKAFLSLGEFAHDATAGIFNDYVALQVWAGILQPARDQPAHWRKERLGKSIVTRAKSKLWLCGVFSEQKSRRCEYWKGF